MTSKMLMTTVWFWLILRSVAASSCSNESPFSSSIIGRRLDLYLTCYPTRYPDHSIVEVNATHLIYFPVHTSYNFGQFCAESYVFKLNRWAPELTHYPLLEDLTENGHQICGAEQERQKVVAWPHGPTRNQYANGLNNTISGLIVLRDTACKEYGYGQNVTAYQHPWVQAPISYLRSVAYNYGFCVDN
eukprot:gb/GEZJ01000227.1/.p1 GENE.gb/GEZJ01000227.1/~~gb/GEZJ01000227.1/.p1  ORF type:complete len:188 (-),score=1.98 gb/GEZJ01000227.1/:607-1170(-)